MLYFHGYLFVALFVSQRKNKTNPTSILVAIKASLPLDMTVQQTFTKVLRVLGAPSSGERAHRFHQNKGRVGRT